MDYKALKRPISVPVPLNVRSPGDPVTRSQIPTGDGSNPGDSGLRAVR